MGFRITDEGQVMQGKNLRHTGADPGRSVKTLMKDIDVALLRHIPGISFIRQPMDRAHPIEGARRKPKQGVERAPLSSTRRRFGTAFARRHVGHIHPPCGLHMATQVCQISGDPGMNRHKRQGVDGKMHLFNQRAPFCKVDSGPLFMHDSKRFVEVSALPV